MSLFSSTLYLCCSTWNTPTLLFAMIGFISPLLALFKHDEHSIPESKWELVGNFVAKLQLRVSRMKRLSACAIKNEPLSRAQ